MQKTTVATVFAILTTGLIAPGCNAASDSEQETPEQDENLGKRADALRMCDPDCFSADRTEVETTTAVTTVYQSSATCPSNARAAHNSATMALRYIYGQDQNNYWGDDVCYKSATVDNFTKLRTFRDLVRNGKCKLGAPVSDYKCGESYTRRSFTCTGITSSQASTLYGLATPLENSCNTLDWTKSSTRPGISAFFYPYGVTKETTKTYRGGLLRSTTYKVVGELDPELPVVEWGIYTDGDWTNGRDPWGNWTSYVVKWPDYAQWGLDPFFTGWSCAPWGANPGDQISGVVLDYGGGVFACK